MDLENTFSEDNITTTVTALNRELPKTKSRDAKTWLLDEISDQFWRTITGQTDPPEAYISYNQLAVENSLVGNLKTEDEDNSKLPWWLRSFKWTFEMIGQETLELPKDNGSINKIKAFDSTETLVYRPELAFDSDGADLQTLLQGLVNLKNELTNSANIEFSEQTVYEDSKTHPQLPADVFDLAGETPVRTTEGFENWLKSLLQLCPPYNETTTALTWYNTGLPRRAMEEMLEDNFNHLKRAGLTSNSSKVWNESYRGAIKQIMDFRGVFDCELSNNSQYQSPMKNSLETIYIQMWLANQDGLSEKQAKAVRLASEESKTSSDQTDEMEYAPCCIELPISYDRKRYNFLTFDTQRRKKRGGFYHGDMSRVEAIIQMIEQANLFPDLKDE